MQIRKQQLLNRYRRNKRVAMLSALAAALLLAIVISIWILPLGLLAVWLLHEALFSDHLFYSAQSDYRYQFPKNTVTAPLQLVHGNLSLCEPINLQDASKATLIVRVKLRSTLLGYWFDPYVSVGCDKQTFERGVKGVRYLNLTGQAEQLLCDGVAIKGKFCAIAADAQLFIFEHTDIERAKTMILAPHADDAELAAFGLYSQLENVSIVTLTQGEIEAKNYQYLGLSAEQAAKLKGRLRAWDSMAIPLWGGVSQANCVQLGYYCMRLAEMRMQPTQAFSSRESGECDTRLVRHQNPFSLPSDIDGLATWHNLVTDLVTCIDYYQPENIVLPHPEMDPHADHIATTQAFYEALNKTQWQPHKVLMYVNHLHDNDRWPMGEAGDGIALPPALVDIPTYDLYCYQLDSSQQIDKVMALRMQHDLQTVLPLKKKIRRLIQRLLVGRRWPVTGQNEFMRKAVRRHELFWVRHLNKEK